MGHLEDLNDEQRAAVLFGSGAALVVAGPGSGKTRTIISRLCRLLEEGVDPRSILLLTFTNKAAREMKERAAAAAGDKALGITAGTFHHFANLLLRRHAALAGLENGFTILDEEDAVTVLSRVMKRSFPDSKRSHAALLLRAISLSKLRMVSLTDAISMDQDLFHLSRQVDDSEALALAYAQEKKSMNAVDFDDLLVLAHRMLRENPELLSRCRSAYANILVDEFQDTDRLQASMLELLYSGNLMVVGDEAQSIYSFRGADIRNMLEFKERYGAKVFFLSSNYRSTDSIVRLINHTIESSSVKIDKRLLSLGKSGDQPLLMDASDRTDEARLIADKVESELLAGRSVGVLFRSVYLASELELELNRRGVAYELRGGVKFTEQAHIKDMLSLLRVHENPRDRTASARLLMLAPGIGAKKADAITEGASTCEEIASRLAKAGRAAIPFSSLLREIFSAQGNAAAMLDRFYVSFYRDYMASAFDDAQERKGDIDALIGAASRFQSTSEFLDSLCLSQERPRHEHAAEPKTQNHGAAAPSSQSPIGLQDPKPAEPKTPTLILSTIHQAKGLEWDSVFVIGLAEGMLPHARAADIEEERRLFYVAVSRARTKLFMSCPRASGRFYEVEDLKLSRFITSLPETCFSRG